MNSSLIAVIVAVPLLILGMFGNLHLIYVTVKFKRLQHRNGILVGIIAFLHFVCELNETKNAIEIFTGQPKMKRKACYGTIVVYQYPFDMSAIAMLFLAIDRLLAVWFPVRYHQMRSTHFIAIALIIGFVYPTSFLVPNFLLSDDALVESCNTQTAFTPGLMLAWTFGNVSIGVIVILLNIVNYFLLLRSGKKHGMSANDIASYQQQAQVTNSLLVMMSAYSLSTFLASAILFSCNLLGIDEDTIGNILPLVSVLVLVNFGNSYYILFWRSRTYRTALLSQLHFKSKGVISVAQATEMHTKIGKNGTRRHTSSQLTKKSRHGFS